MTEIFLHYLTARGSFNAAELAQIAAATGTKQLKRRQVLLRKGDVCRHMTFVVSGALRLYRTDEDGTEHILRFATENWWLNDHESFNSGLPAKGAIDALEDSQLLLWSKADWERLTTNIPALDVVQSRLLSRSLEAHVNRLYTALSHSAEARYQEFVQAFPGLYQRVPLRMIASYLGVSRETLSRIRRHSGGSK